MAKKRIVDYNQGKNVKNPFVNKKKRKKTIAWKRVFKTLLFLAIVGGAGWFFLFCSVWDIKDITIKGTHRVSASHIRDTAETQAEKKKMFVLPQKNLILFDRGEVKRELEEKYHFPKIEINKDIPDKIVITIQENQCRYILKEKDNYYKVDRDNDIIEKVGQLGPDHPVLIENKLSGSKVHEGQTMLDQDYLDYVLELQQKLKQNKDKGITIKKFLLDSNIKKNLEEKNTVKMVLESGPNIYMNMGKSPEQQLERLFILKEKKLKDDFADKKYINLKYEKIFYK